MKYSYFPLLARGMPPLQALEVGGVDYEPETIQFPDWGEYKASGKCPFGYLPLLTLSDGTPVNETNAVLTAVGASCGLLGEGSDFAISMMLACKAAELFDILAKTAPTMFTVKNWG